MKSISYKKDTPQVSAMRLALVMTIGYVLFFAPDMALAQSANFSLPGLDNVLCGIYTYLAKKILSMWRSSSPLLPSWPTCSK